MSCFIAPPVGFIYCIHGDDICSLSMDAYREINGAGGGDGKQRCSAIACIENQQHQVAK